MCLIKPFWLLQSVFGLNKSMFEFFNISFTKVKLNFYNSFSVMDSSTTFLSETSVTLCYSFGKASYFMIDLSFLLGHFKTLTFVRE